MATTFDPAIDPEQVIVLAESKSDETEDTVAWISFCSLPSALAITDNNFDAMFNLHPPKRGTVVSNSTDGERKSPRWHKSYMFAPTRQNTRDGSKSMYMYSGIDESTNCEPLPALFAPYLKWINQNCRQDNDPQFNQVVVNWYADGADYIAMHSDCEIGMVPNATIVSITLTDCSTDHRVFKLNRKAKAAALDKNLDLHYESLGIVLRNGCVITMGGKTQSLYRHGVPKMFYPGPEIKPVLGRRIALTFRQFL